MKAPRYLATPRIQGSEQIDVGGRRYGIPPGAPRAMVKLGSGLRVLYVLDEEGRVHCLTGCGEAPMPPDVERAALVIRLGVDSKPRPTPTAPRSAPGAPRGGQGPHGFPPRPGEPVTDLRPARHRLRKKTVGQ